MQRKWNCQLQNLHTHTTYSDGFNTPEEMVVSAIEKGFSSLGFSEHSYIEDIKGKWLMPENTEEYLLELDRLKEKYKSEIQIFKGIELDNCSDIPTDKFDYIIRNVHFTLLSNGSYVEYCRSPSHAQEVFEDYYNRDMAAFARDYYDNMVSCFENHTADIVGHFDVLTKFDLLRKGLYDFEDKRYKSIALEAIRAVKENCDLFEVNVGHMARGCAHQPCPAPFLLKELKNIGARVLVSTDAHVNKHLDKCIEQGYETLLECGFKSIWVLTDHGFEEQGII